IVRVPSIDPVLIGKVLDEGADGIMLPHATSAEHVKACVAAMYYSPKGRRGFSSSTRQYNYGMNVPADVTAANKPLLFAQIEDVEGVHNANEIAAVAEVDVLFVGPADLKLALKHNAAADLSFETSLEMVAAAAAANNKKAGILVRDSQLHEAVK